jgi:hypothetical protein
VWLVVGGSEGYIEVCRDPSPTEEGYGFRKRHRRGEKTLTPAALSEAAASISDVLGTRRSGAAD